MTPQASENVLSTMRKDGSRRWLKPRLSHGHFLTARRVVAYFLIALFLVLPFLRINSKPAVLLDIVHRRFTLFGYTFLPTDTILLAILMLFLFVGIFLFTAIFGRRWCGWACPQTVYMEFLYRPLERLFDGTTGRGGSRENAPAWGKGVYFLVALLATAIPAHTFLAYFVGVDQLWLWMRHSPLQHPTAFAVLVATVALMMVDFYWFREQLCLIACPYGRFQSALLDKFSLMVNYDKRRGEPRGKMGRHVSLTLAPMQKTAPADRAAMDAAGGPETGTAGDCVDCGMCVTTCPTGIDIRDGLQMECINCAQCIDACDAVMTRLHRPTGLIRHASQATMSGETRSGMRFRLLFYPALLCILASAWIFIFMSKTTADVTLLRDLGSPFNILDNGRVASHVRVKITNRADADAQYTLSLAGLPQATLDAAENPVVVTANQARTLAFVIEVPANSFHNGLCDATLHISDGKTFSQDVAIRLLGPFGQPRSDNDRHEP